MRGSRPRGAVLFAGTASVLLLAACTTGPRGPAMPPPPILPVDTGVFFIEQAGSRIGIERFARSIDGLEAELALFGDAVVVTRAVLRPDAAVERLEIVVYGPAGVDGEPLQSSAARFVREDVLLEQPIGTRVPDMSARAPFGTVPYLNPSPAWLEQILRRARMIGGDSPWVPVWIPGEPEAGWTEVVFDGDAAMILLGPAEIIATTDPAGRLLSATIPAQQITITRR